MTEEAPLESPYRWAILGCFSFTLLTMALQTFTLSSIALAIQDIYSIDEIFIELCSFIFFINYAIFLIPAYYFDDYFDSRLSILVGSLLSFLGSLIRIGAIFSFWWILIGSFVSAISQPFLVNQVTKLSVLWFRSERRATATSISMIFFILGQGGSFAVSGAMVDEDSTKYNVFVLMVVESSLCLIALILVYFLFRDKCSNTMSFFMLMEKGDIKFDLMQLTKNRNFLLLFSAAVISCGNANFFAVLISNITAYYGVGPDKTSILGTTSTIAGLISCFTFSYLAVKLGGYKKICVTTLALSAPFYFLFFIVQKFDIFFVSILASACLGTNIMPIYSLSLELACEVAFPVREVITSGLINCFSQIFGLIPIFIAYLFENNAVFIVCLLLFFQILSAVLMWMVNEKHRRRLMESMSFARNLSTNEIMSMLS